MGPRRFIPHITWIFFTQALHHCSASIISPNLVPRATSTCTMSAISPAPTAIKCGVAGTVRNPANLTYIAATDFSTCSNECVLNDSACMSFSYGPGRQCQTYSEKPADMSFKKKRNHHQSFWNRKCFSETCTGCSSGQTECNGQCTTLGTDMNNCGACGTVCSTNATCSSGSCICTSGDLQGQPSCSDGACPTFMSDNNHCGNCNTQCQSGSSCQSGSCICPYGTNLEDQPTCQGSCDTDFSSDPNNCGQCGTVCPTGAACVNYGCVPACDSQRVEYMVNGDFATGDFSNWTMRLASLSPNTLTASVNAPGQDDNFAANAVGNSVDKYVVDGNFYQDSSSTGAVLCDGVSYTFTAYYYLNSSSHISPGSESLIAMNIEGETYDGATLVYDTIYLADVTTNTWIQYQSQFTGVHAYFEVDLAFIADSYDYMDVRFDSISITPSASSD